MEGASLSALCTGPGTSETTKDQGASWGWVSGLPVVQVGAVRSGSLEDCLTAEEWFELAAGSTGAVWSDLGVVSLRKSAVLLYSS